MGPADLDTRLGRRVAEAADAAVARRGAVSVLDVFTSLGWLTDKAVDRWRRQAVPSLQHVVQVAPDKLRTAVELLEVWAQSRGMEREEGEYLAAARERRELRFLDAPEGSGGTGDTGERAFRTHWIAPDATTAQRNREQKRRTKAPDLVVQMASDSWECAACGAENELFRLMEESKPHCMECVDMGHLVMLPSGDAALTRRAKKESRLSAVVVRWVSSRKKFRRVGLLVEEGALEEAERQCLADEDARARRRERDAERRAVQDVEFQERFAAEILQRFPLCPKERAERIALHTGARGSGRVGRSAAGRDLDPGAVRRAVIASVRHEDTPYDDLLMGGVPREEARARIAADIDRVLSAWGEEGP
ncbi:DUF2293 domain-containing protein [Nocardiopsis sp. RSe5-2]|uniref:DUF2293 domain-containing protein n=1 Tax=Nocardiopsis endophytica TaxID=3018445 RepID=A0ABT4TXT4_9ACTN|nr:DUF2293 domain-containing protein [Nocardiopsis endophytica]MDA2809503.1 DUF2293 domain-containing protein [Nocardiopsis endophytica]